MSRKTNNKKKPRKKTVKRKKKNDETALTLLPTTSIKKEQLLFMLQKTPEGHVYTRKAKGGGEWSFVTGTYIKKVLNYVFGWMWDFEVKEHGREKDLVWVLGRLTIKNKAGKPMVVKEQFGRADVKYYKDKSKGVLDFGNDLKAAATDALKKCASEIGIASDIYGGNEFKEIVKVDKSFTPPENGSPAQPDTQPNKVKDLHASDKDKERIVTIAQELGIKDDDQMPKLIEKKIGIKVDFKSMTKVQASLVYSALLRELLAKKKK